jgi:hypothetical protein
VDGMTVLMGSLFICIGWALLGFSFWLTPFAGLKWNIRKPGEAYAVFCCAFFNLAGVGLIFSEWLYLK